MYMRMWLQCGHYQGDPGAITLVGQSAGGQLGALALLKQAEQAAAGGDDVVGASPAWSPRDLRGFVGASGGPTACVFCCACCANWCKFGCVVMMAHSTVSA